MRSSRLRRVPILTTQSYLILMRDAHLAVAVGSALEDRLTGDGHDALALVPAGHWQERARPGPGSLRAGDGRAAKAPQVVARYKEGLQEWLEALGLPAYVGVPPEEDGGIVRWGGDSGAVLLPVATARDLVDAVADHTTRAGHGSMAADEWLPIGGASSPRCDRAVIPVSSPGSVV